MDLAERLRVLRTGFTRTFWVANILELFERFAFYGIEGGPRRLPRRQRGSRATTATCLVEPLRHSRCLLPADLRGHRSWTAGGSRRASSPASRSSVSGTCSSASPASRSAGRSSGARRAEDYRGSFALVVTAIGGSLIKPCVVGTVARTTTEDTKSLGYSIYYTLVNIGGALGPILAVQVREGLGIAYVLVMSSATSFLLALRNARLLQGARGRSTRGPTRSGRSSRTWLRSSGTSASSSFLVIFSGFWIMFWQVFYSLPFYVRDVLQFERFEILETVDAWTSS